MVPLVKNKAGNLSNINNYRAIAIPPALSKLFECLPEKYRVGQKNKTLVCPTAATVQDKIKRIITKMFPGITELICKEYLTTV